MNVNKFKLFIAAIATAIGGLVQSADAEIAYAYDDSGAKCELIVTVPAGETNTFDSSYLEASVTNLIKRGSGGLTMTDISAFTCTITIESGTYIAGVAGSLGPAVGDVHVLNGATLHTKMASNGANAIIGKRFLIAGKGVDGRGALHVSGSLKTYPLGKSITLTADARIYFSATHYLDADTVVDLQGHTLYFGTSANSFFRNMKFKNPGNVIVENGFLTLEKSIDFGGDASNKYIVHSALEMQDYVAAASQWTLVVTNNGKIIGRSGGAGWNPAKMTNTWAGPVILAKPGRTIVQSRNESNKPTGVAFTGKVSGGGFLIHGIEDSTGQGWSGRFKYPNLHLAGTENDFTNGVEVQLGTLHLHANGALPADGGALIMTNSTVLIENETDSFDLPELELWGNEIVRGGRGEWRNHINKYGSGTVVYDSAVGSGVLNLKEGEFSLATSNITSRTLAGLIEGSCQYPKKNQWDMEDLAKGSLLLTNAITRGMNMLYKSGERWATNTLYTYSGYIWNRSPTNEVWTFAGMVWNPVRFYFDGDLVIDKKNSSDIAVTNITVSSGHHRIVYRIATTAGTQYIGPSTSYYLDNNGTYRSTYSGDLKEDWDGSFGLAYDPLGRGSRLASNYKRIEDPGDGSLLTVCLPEDVPPEVPGKSFAKRPVFDKVCFGDAVFAVNADYWVFDDVEGVPNMSNVNDVTISGCWTLSGADLETKTMSLPGKLSFGGNASFAFIDEKIRGRPAHTVTLASAAGGIENFPENARGLRWRLKVSADGKSILASYYPAGTVVTFR